MAARRRRALTGLRMRYREYRAGGFHAIVSMLLRMLTVPPRSHRAAVIDIISRFRAVLLPPRASFLMPHNALPPACCSR